MSDTPRLAAELWLGEAPGVRVLVEIYDLGPDLGPGFHYRAHDLLGFRMMEVKTIGPMALPDMRRFALAHAAPDATWHPLRMGS